MMKKITSLPLPALPPDPQERTRSLMASEVRQGATVTATAKRYRVSRKAVLAACRDHGFAVSRDGGERVYWIIAALLGSDRRLIEIAEEYGVSKVYVARIYQRCRTAGIPVRERPRGRPRITRESQETSP